MALGDKVEKLQETVTIRITRLATLESALARSEATNVLLAQAVADLQKDEALLKLAVEKDKELSKAEADKLASDFRNEVALLRAENRVEIAALNSWKADLKKREEEWGRRAWSFGPNVVAAVLSIVLSALVAWLMTRRP